jgi:non-ribosomal peptide synthetase component F
MYARLHSILLGGETCTSELLESWLDAGVRVWTAYGATETTSMGCIREVERDATTGHVELALIGKAMALSPVWLVDGDLGIVEDDLVEGEIVIAGDGVAQGYYKDEARTASAFIWWNGRRVYRTGDYGRWVRTGAGSQDRALEFRGRKDRTVKNRGVLVNLDRDVEDGLCRAGAPLGVKSARAAVADNGIVALVSPSYVDTAALLAQAKQTMSAYCIPYRIAAVDDFPLSPNGKAQLQNILDTFAAVDQAGTGQTPGTTSARDTNTSTTTPERGPEEGKLDKILRIAAEVLQQPGEEPRTIRGEDTFLDVGGSSLLALKLVSALHHVHLHVSVRDLFACRTFSDIADLASPTTPSSPSLPSEPSATATPETACMLADLRTQARLALQVAADEDIDAAPLTSLQLELALPTLADPSKSVNQVRLTYTGVHAGMMERAWRAAWQTEPVFRTSICLDVGSGVQVVQKKPPQAPKVEVFGSRQEYEAAVRGSSMAVGLGARLDFLACLANREASENTSEGDGEFTIVLTVHHALMDGCSLRLLLDKIEQTALGWSVAPSPSAVHANLGLINIQRSRDAEGRAFFAGYLRDMPPLLAQTSVGTTPSQKHGVTKTALFDASASMDEVTAFGARHCVSAACVYYTAWALAMSVLERSPRVVVGAVFSNRAALPSEHQDAVGLYMSTLPLAFRFGNDANETVAARLQQTMHDLAAVGEYAWARSDQVGLGPRLRNLLSMQLPLPGAHSRPPAVRAESLENSGFPLSMLVEADGSLRLLYDETQFDARTIRRLGDHFNHALWSLLRERRVEECMRLGRLQESLVSQTERVGFQLERRLTVKQALEEAMDQFTGLTALEDCAGSTVISYGRLARLTEIVARRIQESLVLCGDGDHNKRAIAVYGDGTVHWVLGVLGVVRAGRTFVPLDPKWSVDRMASVCEISGATALLIVPRASQVEDAPSVPGMGVLAVDSMLSSAEPNNITGSRLPADMSLSDSDLLTIVFTSGTTGAPKGVTLSNRGFLALQSTPEGRMFAAPGRRVAQFMSPAFDVCTAEIFSTLLHGATLVLRDPLDPFAHLARVNTASMTPSVLATLEPERFPGLEVVRPHLSSPPVRLTDLTRTRYMPPASPLRAGSQAGSPHGVSSTTPMVLQNASSGRQSRAWFLGTASQSEWDWTRLACTFSTKNGVTRPTKPAARFTSQASKSWTATSTRPSRRPNALSLTHGILATACTRQETTGSGAATVASSSRGE